MIADVDVSAKEKENANARFSDTVQSVAGAKRDGMTRQQRVRDPFEGVVVGLWKLISRKTHKLNVIRAALSRGARTGSRTFPCCF